MMENRYFKTIEEVKHHRKTRLPGYMCSEVGKNVDAIDFLLAEVERLGKESHLNREANGSLIGTIDSLRAEVEEYQFQNDCRSGSDKCSCSEKNGYPCYRHIDHEYRKLFALNTNMTAEVEQHRSESTMINQPLIARLNKAEAQNKVLRETLEKIGRADVPGIESDSDYLSHVFLIAEQALKETAKTEEQDDHHSDLLEYLESTGTPEQLAEAIEEAEDKA